MATIDLGKIKQVWRGTYNNSTAYTVDDLVEYTDSGITSTYICVANSTGNAPSSSGTAHASWNYVAKGVVDPIPSQSGNAGKALITNGSAVSWGQAGTWTKITGGTGPSTAVDAITVDNLFSNSYKYYKVFYSFAEGEVMYFRYVKADGTVQSGGNYQHSVHGANQTVGGSIEHNVWGYNGQNKGLYHWWAGSTDKPAYCEVNLWNPYDSNLCTMDFYSCNWYYSSKIGHQVGSNIYTSAESHRGLYFYHGGSGSQIDTNFEYLVLGAN